jgi:hypothetical protein
LIWIMLPHWTAAAIVSKRYVSMTFTPKGSTPCRSTVLFAYALRHSLAALVKRSPPFPGIPTAEKVAVRTGRRGEPYLILARTVITDVPEAVGP